MEKRELLRILETAFIHLKKDVNYKETKKKYQQALEEIAGIVTKYNPKEAHPVVGESLVATYVKMIKEDPHQCTRENLIGLLREAGVAVIID